ncbi:MAG TPA: hypothetical protein VIR61_06185 [Sulfuricaulis sp.]
MNDSALKGMLKLIADHERESRDSIGARAESEARGIIAEAYRHGRERMHQTIVDLRSGMRREIARADAALETARRQHRARCEFAMLESAAEPLRAALIERWRDTASRASWVARLVSQAHRVLPANQWNIFHAPGWTEPERRELAHTLAHELDVALQFHERADIAAGLRICARGACLDGTLEGLLADHDGIHGRLLAEVGE